MGARFAGKYDILDQEVKLGLQILSAVEAASGRRVKIYCLPLSALQIELPCPPEFIERRFRSAVTLEGEVVEADVDPETENAYVVVGTPGASKSAGFAAPTMEFNAWRGSATHQAPNDDALAAATMERPAWPDNSAIPSQPRPSASAEPAVSFTKLFAETPSAVVDSSVNSAAPSSPPPTPVESAPAAKKPMESFTAFFKVGSSASRTPEPKPEFAPRIDPAPPAAPPQAGGFTAFFGASKSSPASPEPTPSPFAAPAPAPAFGSSEPPGSPGGFTQLFGGAAASAEAKEIGGVPQAQFTKPAPKNPPAGSFTAMFSNEPPSSTAPTTEPNFTTPQPAKAPGAFTELFRRMPDLQASPSPLTAEPAVAPPAPAARQRSDGFTAIFGAPNAPPVQPTPPAIQTPPTSTPTPSPDLTPRLDGSGAAMQYGTPGNAASPQPQAAPAAASRPSQYTMVRKGWTAPPPPSAPGVPAPSVGSAAAPQMPGGVPAPQWPSAPAMPTMPTPPQMPMAAPQMAAAQPQASAYPGFQPPAAPAWPPQAMPPQPAMPAPPMAAPAAQGLAKTKPSYLPLIIILNALFLLAVVIVLFFVLTKH